MAASLIVSRSVTEIQNLLVCDVCKKTINEPKILPCSHSFCKACLENLTTQDEENVDGEGKKLDCPTCTTTVALKTNESVAALPDNKFIAKLLTAIGPDRKQETSMCSQPRCKKEPSITICMECEMLLCHECYTSHESWPPMQCHTMLSISEIINHDEQQKIGTETLSCTQHKDAIPKFYCETCKELICMKCVASVHTKPGHACVAIHEIFRNQKDAVKSKCATINAMKLEGTKVGTQLYICTIAHSYTDRLLTVDMQPSAQLITLHLQVRTRYVNGYLSKHLLCTNVKTLTAKIFLNRSKFVGCFTICLNLIKIFQY